jgi:hypothetical protein
MNSRKDISAPCPIQPGHERAGFSCGEEALDECIRLRDAHVSAFLEEAGRGKGYRDSLSCRFLPQNISDSQTFFNNLPIGHIFAV